MPKFTAANNAWLGSTEGLQMYRAYRDGGASDADASTLALADHLGQEDTAAKTARTRYSTVRQSATPFGTLPGNLGQTGALNEVWKQNQANAQQNTYMTPDQFGRLFQQMTQPAVDTLSRQYQQSYGQAQNDFANRGSLYGGSLTGALGQLGAQHTQNLQDLLSNVGGQLGNTNLQLGAQRQMGAQNNMADIVKMILQGGYGLHQQSMQNRQSNRGAALGAAGAGLGAAASFFK